MQHTLILPPPISTTTESAIKTEQIPGEIKLTQTQKLLRTYLTYSGFSQDIIDIYNEWVSKTLFKQFNERQISNGNGSYTRVTQLYIERPKTTNGQGKEIPLTPMMARYMNADYVAKVYANLEYYFPATEGVPEKVEGVKNYVHICNIPVMVGSIVCNLYGKSDKEKIELGECPNDPMSYFIIKGHEKIILMQENLRLNKFFIFHNKLLGYICRSTMYTPKGSKIVTLTKGKKGDMRLNLPLFGRTKSTNAMRGIPFIVAITVLGRAINSEIFTNYDAILERILWFIQPKYHNKIRVKYQTTIVQASKKDYIQKLIDNKSIEMEIRSRMVSREDVKNSTISIEYQLQYFPTLLYEQLFPNIDGVENKLIQLCMMAAHFYEYLLGIREVDDRDSWANKRVETAGKMLEHLFTSVWNETVNSVQRTLAQYNGVIKIENVVNAITSSNMSKTLIKSFDPNSWGPNASTKKENATDYLKRESPLATYSHVSLINTPTSRHTKQASIRIVQMSQLGYVDPVETSEGKNCGLVKSRSVTCRSSMDRDDSVIKLLVNEYVSTNPTEGMRTAIVFNGKYYGWCNGEIIKNFLIKLRRKGKIYRDTAIVLRDKLYINTDGSRLIRPLLIVENGELLIDKKKLWNASFAELLDKGVVEYIDPFEQEDIMLAYSVDVLRQRRYDINSMTKRITELQNMINQLQNEGVTSNLIKRDLSEEILRNLLGDNIEFNDKTYYEATRIILKHDLTTTQESLNKLLSRSEYTHCELDSSAILGVASSIIPLPEHNQAPRNVYQTAMGKQALGIYHSNYMLRFDTTAKTLAFPTRPLFETQMANVIGLNTQPIGQNVVLAIMTYGGYNQEDALIFNKASIERGLFKIQVHRSYSTVEEDDSYIKEIIQIPPLNPTDSPDKYAHLDTNGIARLGSVIKEGMVIIGKMRINIKQNKTINASVIAGVGETGVVSNVVVSKTINGNKLVHVKITDTRNPVIGDKFASRHAQKATIGIILPEEDMPFSEKGIRPDLIMNPHAIPSRMTIAKLIEIVASKVAALDGERLNATAFANFNIDTFRRNLLQYGYKSSGNEILYSGLTGKKFHCEIFIGPCYYQALKHHVKDKIQMRSTGEVKLLTHQPIGGRPRRGGLRSGEMEKDAFVTHGATSVVMERLCTSSDAYKAVFCKECGRISISDALTQTQFCRCCNNTTNFGTCQIPFAYRLLQNLLSGANISIRYKLKENK